MDPRVFVSAGLLLFGLVTVAAQSNSANEGRGLLICFVRVNDGAIKNEVELLRRFMLACIMKITLVNFYVLINLEQR